MLWLDSSECIEDDQIIITQTYHQIAFFTYDINDIVPFNTKYVDSYFLPECNERDQQSGKCIGKQFDINNCLNCNELFRIEEISINGFWAERDGYIVLLQTGIKVPITKEFYKEVKKIWDGKFKSNSSVYRFGTPYESSI
jgi:hypothetical protein